MPGKHDVFGHAVSLKSMLDSGKRLKGIDSFAKDNTNNLSKQNSYNMKEIGSTHTINTNIMQPEKRLVPNKHAIDIYRKIGRRNYSIDPPKKGTFEHLQHPYQWNAKSKQSIKHSFVQGPKLPSIKVTQDSFDSKHYKENSQNNSPVLRGMNLAMRPKYHERYDLSENKFTNIKYFKNYSTLGTNEYDDFRMTDHVSLHNPKSFDTTITKFKIKRDVSPKVGQSASQSLSG